MIYLVHTRRYLFSQSGTALNRVPMGLKLWDRRTEMPPRNAQEVTWRTPRLVPRDRCALVVRARSPTQSTFSSRASRYVREQFDHAIGLVTLFHVDDVELPSRYSLLSARCSTIDSFLRV